MDAEVEPRDPADADWLDRQRRWTQGRRRFVVPTVFLVYLLYVAGGVAHYNDGAAVILGEVILVAFAACYLVVIAGGPDAGARRFWIPGGICFAWSFRSPRRGRS